MIISVLPIVIIIIIIIIIISLDRSLLNTIYFKTCNICHPVLGNKYNFDIILVCNILQVLADNSEFVQ